MAKGKYEYWLTKDGLLLLESWARDGLTYEQISKNMSISRKTLFEWIKKHSDIRNALCARARDLADIEVENALRKRALGYTIVEVTTERVWNKALECYELVVTKTVEKQIAPDVQAQIFWLKNRRPEIWREKREVALAAEDAPKDDGFLDALNAEAAEVMADGGDTPQNLSD